MRAKKIKPMKNIYKRDIEFFKALSNCGHITKQLCFDNFENTITNKRIDTYVKNGIVQQVADRDGISYKFTSKGKDYVRDLDVGINHFYHSQSAYHDLKIAEKYLSLEIEERNSWRNETQLMEEFNNYCHSLIDDNYDSRGYELLEQWKNDEISIPDGCYVSKTEEIIIWEAITNSYGEQELQSKREFANVMDYEIQFSKK